MALNSFCAQLEGFGPSSSLRTLDFTPCFEDIVLSLVPNVILIIVAIPRSLYLLRKPARIIEKTWLYWSKIITITILAILKAILIAFWAEIAPISQAAIVSNSISLAAVLTLLCLSHLEHFRSLRPSPFLLSYLLVTIFTDAIQVRTYASIGMVDDVRFALFAASLAVRVMVFVFENIEKRNLLRESWMQSEKFAPESTANWFSKLSFSWIIPLMNTGTRKYLEMDDLWDLDVKMRSQVLSQKMQKHWDEQKVDGRSPSIYKALFRTFGATFLLAIIPRLMYSALNLTKPTLISEMIVFIDSYSNQTLDYTVDDPTSPQPAYVGFGLVAAIFLVSLLGSIVNAMFSHMTVSLGVKVRGALVAMIYQKSLRVRSSGLGQNWKGEVVNHMSSDVEKLLNVFNLLHSFWAGAVEIGVASWLLYNQVSLATFAAIGVLIICFTLAALFSPFFAKWQRTKMKRMGERIQKMTEMVSNMKSVKLNGYEPYFTKRVTDARVTEVVALKAFWRWASYYAAVTNSAGFFLPLVTIGTYAGLTIHGGYGTLDVRRIFTVITLIQLIRAPLFLIGSAFTTVVGSKVSFSRIEAFLKKDDIDPNNVIRRKLSDYTMNERITANDTFTEKLSDSIKPIEDAAIEIKHASFSWNVAENDFKLEDINIRVSKGTSMAIVGQIGQGKSSLIESIIGETFKLSGTVTVTGSIAYVPQVAWVLNTTVRENIVFGRPWDEHWYKKVVTACSLDSDFSILSHGDMTLIGEKGINLSGGQKQRVSIARAVYSKADIYLFDDPLSALDAHVDQQVFSNIIAPNGLLATKTRLLITHAIHHLPSVDYIITLKQGRIVERGTYTELMTDKGEFYTLISENLKHDSKSTNSQNSTLAETTAQSSNQDDEKNHLDAKDSKPNIVESEVKGRGRVPFSVYSFYLKAAGYDGIIMMLVAFSIGTTLNVAQQLWLNNWGEYNVIHPDEMVGFYMGIYSALNIGSFAAISISISLLLVVVVPKASKRMHNWELNPVIRSPMAFFDTTSSGKIINRFTTDLTSVDFEIPTNYVNFTAAFMQIIGAIIMICLATPWFTILLVPLAFFYWLGQRYYLVSSREIRRLDSAAKSPLYSHCGETLGGLSSVRAYGDQTRFSEHNIKLLDESQRVAYIRYAIQRWLQLLLDLLGTSIIVSLSLIAVLTRSSASAGLVGVALANTINITAEIDDLMKNYANLEQAVVAVERIKEFSELKPEGRDIIPDSKLPPAWPTRGKITFENYSTKYREDLDLALKNISFNVLPGEKVGIVGRTGAGKSSITMALLRIIEPVAGTIFIDDENICDVGLQDLRSRISIIPQDPFLWGTTIRENLDPYSKHTDMEIWNALEYTGLNDIVSAFDEKLDHVVQNGGENFSLGQRQLFCLSRVLLRRTMVIIMDEATAAIDVETDNKIQRTIREKLKNYTVLTIAHRIGTIMDSDRILVLDHGEIVEFSSPQSLLAKKESVFYGLALQAGQISSS